MEKGKIWLAKTSLTMTCYKEGKYTSKSLCIGLCLDGLGNGKCSGNPKIEIYTDNELARQALCDGKMRVRENDATTRMLQNLYAKEIQEFYARYNNKLANAKFDMFKQKIK